MPLNLWPSTLSPPAPLLVPGLHYGGGTGTGTGTALTGLRAYAMPFYVSNVIGVDRLVHNVATGAAGALFRCAIWDDDGPSGLPGSLLIAPTVDLDAATTGTKTDTGVSGTLYPGWVWVGLFTNASGTFTPTGLHAAYAPGYNVGTTSGTTSSTVVIGTIVAFANASVATFPSPAATNIAAPRVQFRTV